MEFLIPAIFVSCLIIQYNIIRISDTLDDILEEMKKQNRST